MIKLTKSARFAVVAFSLLVYFGSYAANKFIPGVDIPLVDLSHMLMIFSAMLVLGYTLRDAESISWKTLATNFLTDLWSDDESDDSGEDVELKQQ